ncbi:MAG: tRNA epoxyqueuosine(34) reductase QueG [Planctomycetota bacterium]|nr:tRNA epoxyqueuosine(34) reductase QueG [Planctomycetota bacterium]
MRVGDASHRAAQTGAILDACTRLGFVAAGVARAEPSRWEREFRQWLAAGKHGSMAYLSENVEQRLDIRRMMRGAASVVMVADRYATRSDGPDPDPPPGFGRVARYARGRDYHVAIKKRLRKLLNRLHREFPGHMFRPFIDLLPMLEREHAHRAGLGWTGKNTMLIHPRLGSYLLLGGFVTTLELEPTPEADRVPDHCGTCSRCIDACPTRAITAYSVDASRCISYLTIERRGLIEIEVHAAIGDRVFGCDVCQEVCPHNSLRTETMLASTPESDAVLDAYRSRFPKLDLLKVLGWSEAEERAAHEGSALKRAFLDGLKRNALIVMTNQLLSSAPTGDARTSENIRRLISAAAVDPVVSDTVRATAAQCLARLDALEKHETKPANIPVRGPASSTISNAHVLPDPDSSTLPGA